MAGDSTLIQLQEALGVHAPGVTLLEDRDLTRMSTRLRLDHNIDRREITLTDSLLVNEYEAQNVIVDRIRQAIEMMRADAIRNLGLEPIIQGRIDAAVRVETDRRERIAARIQEQIKVARGQLAEIAGAGREAEPERLHLLGEVAGLKAAASILEATSGA